MVKKVEQRGAHRWTSEELPELNRHVFSAFLRKVNAHLQSSSFVRGQLRLVCLCLEARVLKELHIACLCLEARVLKDLGQLGVLAGYSVRSRHDATRRSTTSGGCSRCRPVRRNFQRSTTSSRCTRCRPVRRSFQRYTAFGGGTS